MLGRALHLDYYSWRILAVPPVGRSNHSLEESIQGCLWIGGRSGMDRRSLDDRAAGRGQPVEAVCRRPGCRLAGGQVTVADQRDEREVVLDLRRIALGREGGEPRWIKLDAGAKEGAGAAEKNDPGIDELLALDPRHDADHGVVKRPDGRHQSLLRRSGGVIRGGRR